MILKRNILILFGIVFILVAAGCIKPKDVPGNGTNVTENGTQGGKASLAIPKFGSCSELEAKFNESRGSYYGGYYALEELSVPSLSADAGAGSVTKSFKPAPDYSETNVQVKGVDEADIVKTDGEYIYTVSNQKLHIVKAYPAASAEEVSTVDLNVSPYEIFIDGDKILLFSQSYNKLIYYDKLDVPEKPSYYYPSYTYFTSLQIWDTSNKEKPELAKEVEIEGDYVSSRKIGSDVYFVINNYPDYYYWEDGPVVPLYKENGGEAQPIADCGDIGYLEPINAQNFVIVGSLSMDDLEKNVTKEVIVASGESIYASQNNLYFSEQDYSYEYVTGPLFLPRQVSTTETVVHKFALDAGSISYLGSMRAPGTILNQFSMDESNGYFRIATTVGHVSRSGGGSSNNVYIFDDELKMVGKLEDLAPGERIYSARFMGDKAYLVTFKKVDPLFVLDLSNPEDPKVLGKLKIPGYSDYLHPIDENHIIGLGKETVEAEEGDFAWYQGIKMAGFDVSDVENPKEMHKIVIGDRGTDSYALYDHKAFLYDKQRSLLVIPVLLAEIDDEDKFTRDEWGSSPIYGDYKFQGAYVYDLTLENGFNLEGRVTHLDDNETFLKSGYYYYDDGSSVKRALYIGDYLYTISDKKILVNSLDGLELVKEVELEYDEPDYPDYWVE